MEQDNNFGVTGQPKPPLLIKKKRTYLPIMYRAVFISFSIAMIAAVAMAGEYGLWPGLRIFLIIFPIGIVLAYMFVR